MERMTCCREVPKADAQNGFSRFPENLRSEFFFCNWGMNTTVPEQRCWYLYRKGDKFSMWIWMQNQGIGVLTITRSSLPWATGFCCDLDVDHWMINWLVLFQIPLVRGHCIMTSLTASLTSVIIAKIIQCVKKGRNTWGNTAYVASWTSSTLLFGPSKPGKYMFFWSLFSQWLRGQQF